MKDQEPVVVFKQKLDESDHQLRRKKVETQRDITNVKKNGNNLTCPCENRLRSARLKKQSEVFSKKKSFFQKLDKIAKLL